MSEGDEARRDLEMEARKDLEIEEFRAENTMYNDRVRATLSGVVLVGFVVTLLAVLLMQYVGAQNAIEPGALPTIESVGSIYAGVTGVILGYYFGKSQ